MGEIDAWYRWELGASEAETLLLEVTEEQGRGAAVEQAATALRQAAARERLTLERALAIRERAWSVAAERTRLLGARALLQSLEAGGASRGSRQRRELRRAVASDVSRYARAAESRAVYGDAWVDALLGAEAKVVEVYRAALGKGPRRP